MLLSKTLFALLLPALLVPVAVALLVVFARLFEAMGHPAARVIDWSAFVLAVLWLTDLVALVFVLTVRALLPEPPDPPQTSRPKQP